MFYCENPVEAFARKVWLDTYTESIDGIPFSTDWERAYHSLYGAINLMRAEGRDNEAGDFIFLARIAEELSFHAPQISDIEKRQMLDDPDEGSDIWRMKELICAKN